MILLVTYELNGKRDYANLYSTLKTASSWWHYLESTWLLSTHDDPQTWRERLQSYIDSDADSILIIEIKNNYSGWLPKKAWDWIKSHLDAQSL